MLEPIATMSIASVSTVILAVMGVRLRVGLHRFTVKRRGAGIPDLPSVSVCIPARNEQHALIECLERVLASDYSKIEIIVFDDNSSDDTSLLVKSFAHAGVRFVPGVPLPDGWLGKNHALSILAREASGAKLLFLDVDTKIGPTTVSQLVDYGMVEAVDMVSVLPLRRQAWRPSVFLTPLRYLWEILLSARDNPATTSALWMIDRGALLGKHGAFTPYAGDVRPEQRLAERLGTERYHFLIATRALDVYQEKKWSSQLETSRRLLYPMVGMSPFAAFAATIFLMALCTPIIGVFVAIASSAFAVAAWFGALTLGFMGMYGTYTARVWGSSGWFGALAWPVLLVQEICLMIASVVGYATRTVTWKGRLVTAPVVQDDYIVIDE